MKSLKIYILPIVLFALPLLSINQRDGKMLIQSKDDSLVHHIDNYIQYVNGIASRSGQYMSTYIKIEGKEKFKANPDPEYWPDSIEETVNVIRYKKEPIEYAETPLIVPTSTNLEYDNYYYKGKLMAYRVFEVLNNCECAGGTLTNTMTAYYDSTGRNVRTLHTMFGSNNQPIDTTRCPIINDFSHLYKSYSETPLAKEGIETKAK